MEHHHRFIVVVVNWCRRFRFSFHIHHFVDDRKVLNVTRGVEIAKAFVQSKTVFILIVERI